MVDTTSDLRIPPSPNVIDVRVINSTTRVKMPLAFFIKDPMPGHDMLQCPSYSFLIESQLGKKILFDLGMRKDKESFPPLIRDAVASLDMNAEKDVATILQEDGSIALDEIDSIISSHWHTDHIGDPSTFPSTAELVIGPGSKNMLLPGYPANPNGIILESDYSGRQVREISFETGLKIGQFRAMDFFGDGSFYLLDSPGHALGHMCALARTTPSTFIFLGGDGCHHCGSIRPSKQLPLPNEMSPSPFSVPPYLKGSICPGRDVPEAEATISKMVPFDASEDVFVIVAHDGTLSDVIDFFPKKANGWKEKGWKETSRWRFLADFKDAAAKADIA
ncbi:beta-lactamase-like protein [Camillea tinctor]|nr:beta-lactamase-like protein [Camillea tinctor]